MSAVQRVRMDTQLHGTNAHAQGTDGVLAPRGGLLVGGRYEVRGLLGRGGMAEVCDGWDVKLNRPVAIKLLYPMAAVRPESRLRFESEARAAAQLTGRHVVVIHDVGEHDGLPFIVMERLPGVSLADHIARGPLPPAFVHVVLCGVLDALAEAHSRGILHRDVKPGNILFTATGEPKLADFGIAKTAGAVSGYTKTGEIIGSMAYMSPDRLIAKPATVADDLYAVGVVGYEALIGRRPFPHAELGPLAHAILHDTPPPLAAQRPDVPPGLATAIERAMARDPAWRFGDAHEMRAALDAPIRPPVAVRPATRVMEAPPPALLTYTPTGAGLEHHHSRRKLWLAAIAALFILALMLFMLFSPFSTPPPVPATTTTPLPPPTTTALATTTPSSTDEPPPPAPPPAHHPGPGKGKKRG
ncbi:serine/threonine-protein kinase [Mycobacterium sp.]|uniref:serine/threonine-protein kinase n=1 Tax=Mycobacterium sp. TaxID=1785 RepID=UPI0025ECA0C5|nr:serine/threonine-protein kinase [Mycobacterium sp.]